jgi:hypothetical protein
MLYQLSYASGAVAANGSLRKIGSVSCSVKACGREELGPNRFERKRKGSLEKSGSNCFTRSQTASSRDGRE